MIGTRDRFKTLADARTELDGTADWEWLAPASWDGWTEYAYRHATESTDGFSEWAWDHDATLREYLASLEVDPSDYGV